MTNLREVLSKLAEACNGSIPEVDVFIDVNNTMVSMYSVSHFSNVPSNYSVPTFRDSWHKFASALRDIKEMIIQSCNVSNSTSASAINITELNLNGDNNGIGVYSFIGGFMSGVLAARLIVASYYLLKKCITKTRKMKESVGYASYEEAQVNVSPSNVLDDSEGVEVSDKSLLM